MFESTDLQAFVLEYVLFFTDYNLHKDIKKVEAFIYACHTMFLVCKSGEWFYNATTKMLYLYPNGTLPTEGIGTILESLIEVHGRMDSPVVNVTLMDLEFAHTTTTFFSDYEVPSGSDWSVHRGGAVLVEGTEHFLLLNCLFNAPGGNGLYLSRFAVVEGNEFVRSGDSGIVAVGTSDHIDGTLGTQPRGNKIIGNLVHENGVFGKQTHRIKYQVSVGMKPI